MHLVLHKLPELFSQVLKVQQGVYSKAVQLSVRQELQHNHLLHKRAVVLQCINVVLQPQLHLEAHLEAVLQVAAILHHQEAVLQAAHQEAATQHLVVVHHHIVAADQVVVLQVAVLQVELHVAAAEDNQVLQ